MTQVKTLKEYKKYKKTNLNPNQYSPTRTAHTSSIIVHNCGRQYSTEQFR